MLTLLLVGIIFFLDIFFDYSENQYKFLMYALPYTFVCVGITYLSNIMLTILHDIGKRRWLLNEDQL